MHASRRQRRSRPFSPPMTGLHQAAPAYKVAKLVRGQQGFGFTISGQAPCILSCVVPNSSADRAGLQAGDCLLAVNGCDVSRAPHDEVVRLVGSCMGTLKLHLAEASIPAAANGYSSSDEGSDTRHRMPSKTRPPRTRHATRSKRKGATPPSRAERVVRDLQSGLLPVHHHPGSGTKSRRRRNSSGSSPEHIANLMASPNLHVRINKSLASTSNSGQLMYRSVVGYLGTIEMPEDSGSQSSPSSGVSAGAQGSSSGSNSAAARLAAIRSCVRRLRIEKKVHTLVLFRVWGARPAASGAAAASSGKITLTSPAGANLARFPARRVVFCGAYADDARFFGLVTSAAHASDDDEEDDEERSDAENKMLNARKTSTGFTSCHVFMVDSRLVGHDAHAARAHAFRFQCTAAASGDGRCLEFPPTAEPILQAVLSLCASSTNSALGSGLMGWANPFLQQQEHQQANHQPQQVHNLSSHSSSSSSNSDSGIFRDRDDGKSSDRDLRLHHEEHAGVGAQAFNGRHQRDRLTVRAMPDPLGVRSPGEIEHAARLRSSMQRYLSRQQPQPAMMLLNRSTGTHQHVNPSLSVRATMTLEEKLSPQVYKARPVPSSNRPTRTPSERSRARSLDDLSKSCEGRASTGEASGQRHAHPHLHLQAMGSDNGLDRIDWDKPFHPVAAPPPIHWHNLLPASPKKKPTDEVAVPTPILAAGALARLPSPVEPTTGPCHSAPRDQPAEADPSEASDENARQPTPVQQPPQHAWTQGFEKLLEDPLGVRAFAGFLKKEFSHENIYFWAACERFHRLFPTDDAAVAASEAQKIFDRHLGPSASEPVNVDSQARQMAEDNLSQPGPELFDQAQKQVFNLMKYDCYPRFLRSAIYRECMEAVENNQAPPISESVLNDPDLNVDYDTADGDGDTLNRNALKKSESDAGERRRRSLLPWPKKDRSKSKDRSELDVRKSGKKKNRLGSTSSGPDKDKENGTDDEEQLMMRRAASRDSVTSEFSDKAFQIQNTSSTVPLVKVLLPDGSSAVIAARPGQSVQQLLGKLLERRGLRFNAFELYDNQAAMAIDLDRDASALRGLEVRIEPRVVFHLILVQSSKSLMIRGQPKRQLGEVVKPILAKYGLKMDNSVIVKAASGETVQAKTLLASLDGLHLKVWNRDEASEESVQLDSSQDATVQMRSASMDATEDAPSKSGGSLLLRKGLTRRNSLQADRNRSVSGKKHLSASSLKADEAKNAENKRHSAQDLSKSSQSTGSLMPPPRAPLGARKLISQRNPLSRLENEALYERLKRAQRSRLEDQRGTEINFELPDFLKLPGRCAGDEYTESREIPIDGRASEPILGCRPRLVYQESYEFPLDGRASEPLFNRREAAELRANGSCASPDFAAIASQILEKSFSTDGLLPTHEQAEKYFGSVSQQSELRATPAPSAKITVAAAKQNVANVAARIAAIEHHDRATRANQLAMKSSSNSNWDDLLLDLDVDWRCYQGTDDQKQQLQQQNKPKSQTNNRPPLPTPPALELLDLDDPLIATSPAPPPPLPPKPGKIKLNEVFKTPTNTAIAPPRPPSRTVIPPSRVNVSFV